MSTAGRRVFFATCARGVEEALQAEARALRLSRLERQVGGVRFEGTLTDAWRANLLLRTAMRVLCRIDRFQAADADQLYAHVRDMPWEEFLAADGRLVVQAQSRESALDHTQFVEQRVKDAIVDRFRARTGRRPSVDRERPDLGIHVHLYRDRATLSLDTSGEPLYKRGWRVHQGRSPLSETLAAAMVAYAGWDRAAPLVDPFAGSGTIVIEAALAAAGIAPGARRAFAFERWPGHDERRYRQLSAELTRPSPPRKRARVIAQDVDPERVEETRANAESAGVAEWIECRVGDARELELRAGWNAWVITNPPYGRRSGAEGGRRSSAEGVRRSSVEVGDEAGSPKRAGPAERSDEVTELYRGFGALLRERGRGTTLALLAERREHVRALALRGLERRVLMNGGLACVLAVGKV